MIDNECFERVGFFLSARDLKKMDTFSNTDPYAIVLAKDPKTGVNTKLGITNVIMDSQNPNWPTQFIINYYFEVTQEITVKIYDRDGEYPLEQVDKHHEFCGEVSFQLSTLMCCKGQCVRMSLRNGLSGGTCNVQAEAVANTRDEFNATFVGSNLTNTDGWFATSSPFLRILRLYETGDWGLCYETSPVKSNLNPHWAKGAVPLVSLCNGDVSRPLRIELWAFQSSGSHRLIGGLETNVQAMVSAGGSPMNVINKETQRKAKHYINSGTLSAQNCFIEQRPTFTDFIMGGCEISLMVAIDFTASNGPAYDISSLHYINASACLQYNQYEQAVLAIGNVLENYDTDRMYPVYGFGAKVKLPDGSLSTVQHCFPVYGGGVEVQGTAGIMQAYRDCLNNVALSGPTLFAPLISTALGIAASSNCSQSNQKYTILLILTDGEVNDMDQTIHAIVQAALQPLSIIIVGVGNADFTNMNTLDSDGVTLRSGQQTAVRDIVQFVPFREFAGKGSAALAQEVLAEIPSQVLKYMSMKGINPNPKK